MLDRSTSLPDGTRVRIRLPHGSDRRALRSLHERAGSALDDLALTRLLRVDPRRRCALVATAWIAGAEAIVAFAACDVHAGDPDVLVADPALHADLGDLMARALRAHTSRVA